MIPLLQKKGFNVTAVQLPLTSLSDDIAATRNLLSMQKGPIVLVGHSYGGAVITGAANEAPNVTSLVYMAAFGLHEGESVDGVLQQGPAPAGAAQIRPDDQVEIESNLSYIATTRESLSMQTKVSTTGQVVLPGSEDGRIVSTPRKRPHQVKLVTDPLPGSPLYLTGVSRTLSLF